MIELNREQTVTALQCCAKASGSCVGCPLDGKCEQGALEENALSLIKKLTEEIERLNAVCAATVKAWDSDREELRTARVRMVELIKENECLSAINTLQEQDIADRDEMLNKKVEEVYPEFMRDYELLVKDIEGYHLDEAEFEAQVRADTVRKMQERVKRELLQYDDYDELYVKTVRDCMTHIAQELIGGEGAV